MTKHCVLIFLILSFFSTILYAKDPCSIKKVKTGTLIVAKDKKKIMRVSANFRNINAASMKIFYGAPENKQYITIKPILDFSNHGFFVLKMNLNYGAFTEGKDWALNGMFQCAGKDGKDVLVKGMIKSGKAKFHTFSLYFDHK